MVVSNATALIVFARIERLDLLQHAYNELYIPEEVERELTVPGKPGAQEIERADWIHTETVKNRSFLQELAESLDAGEAEAIALAKEQGAIFLSDDGDARKVALKHTLPLNSSLTVLRANKASGNVQEAKGLLDQMIANDFRLSDQVYEEFLSQIDELNAEDR